MQQTVRWNVFLACLCFFLCVRRLTRSLSDVEVQFEIRQTLAPQNNVIREASQPFISRPQQQSVPLSSSSTSSLAAVSCSALRSFAVVTQPHGKGFALDDRPVEGESFPELRFFGISWENRQFRMDQPPLRRSSSLKELVERVASSNRAQSSDIAWTRTLIPSSDNVSRRVYFVQNADSCLGALVIEERKSASSALTFATKLQPSTDDGVRHLIQNTLQLGGRDFRVRLVGSHIVSRPLIRHSCASLESACELYILPFDIATPAGDPPLSDFSSSFVVEAELMYSEWDGLDEQRTDTTPMQREAILAEVVERKSKLGVIEGAQHHNPQLNLHTFFHPEDGKWIRKSKFRSSKLFTWDQFTFHSGELLTCPISSALKQVAQPTIEVEGNCLNVVHVAARRPLVTTIGEWVRYGYDVRFPRNMTEEQMKFERNHHVHFERTNPQALYSYRVASDICPSGMLGFANPKAFLGKVYRNYGRERLRIHFVGDSHVRVAAVHLRNFLARSDGESSCPLEDHGVKSMGERLYRLTSLLQKKEYVTDVHYANDVLLEKFSSRRSGTEWFDVCKTSASFCKSDSDATILVLGMGSWAIGGKGPDAQQAANGPADYGHWSLGKFHSAMRQIAKTVRVFLSEHEHAVVVWLSIPAYPPNTRRYAKLRGEHRTNPRIFVMNAISMEVLAKEFENDSELSSRVRFVDSFDVTYPVMHLSLDHNHFTTYPQDAILQLLLNAMQ